MKKIVTSEKGNVHYLQFQSGTNKRDLYSGSYAVSMTVKVTKFNT